MTEKKGHRYTLKAFAGLMARRPGLAAHLDMIGNGPQLEEMRDLVEQLGLAAHATVHGGLPHDQVRDLLNQANVFVLPSVTAADGDMEGIPVSIMEAMAMGLPIVSTRHSGIPELVADGISGLLVAEHDIPALTGAFERLIDTPGLIVRMGLAGRSIVERDYSATRQCAVLRAWLERLAS
jgi:colanic acid/amylovoran biosynthesis glycosyltransferase